MVAWIISALWSLGFPLFGLFIIARPRRGLDDGTVVFF